MVEYIHICRRIFVRSIFHWHHFRRPRLAVFAAALLLVLSACGGDSGAPAGDPPGALVRLQRVDNVSLPGDFTVFSSGSLQLYLDNRGALRKAVPATDLAGLQAAINDPAVGALADAYPATLPAGAGDLLTIYGSRRRSIRYDPRALDLPPALQSLIDEILRLRGRF
jgi:hypothetical protein